MTTLEHITIDGLAGRAETLDVPIDNELTVFWGLNGSGKTSLLRVIHSALSADTAALHRMSLRACQVKFFSENRGGSLIREYERVPGSEERARLVETDDGEVLHLIEEESVVRWSTKAPTARSSRLRNVRTERRFSHSYLPTSRLDLQRSPNGRAFSIRTETVSESTYDEAFGNAINALWIKLNNATLSAQRSIQQRGLADIMNLSVTGTPPESLPSDAADIGSLEAFNIFKKFLSAQGMQTTARKREFLERYDADPAQRLIIASIEKLNEDMARASVALDNLFELVERMFSGSKRLEREAGRLVLVSGTGDRIPLSGLSSGEKQLVYILLECIAANNNVVIIDEPELSLHVDWQETLISAIRTVNPHVQLVLATHSPEIMANVPDRNIFEL